MVAATAGKLAAWRADRTAVRMVDAKVAQKVQKLAASSAAETADS